MNGVDNCRGGLYLLGSYLWVGHILGCILKGWSKKGWTIQFVVYWGVDKYNPIKAWSLDKVEV